MLNHQSYCQPISLVMRTLQSMGICNMATELALHKLPLAERIKNFLPNWEVITQDSWVKQTVHGYTIDFQRKPYQNHRPPLITFSKKKEQCMESEIQSMLDKQAISQVGNNPQGFYSRCFWSQKKMAGKNL